MIPQLRTPVVLLLTALLWVAGCGKDGAVSDNKPFASPVAQKVVQALEKKEYEAVVAGLAEFKAASTDEAGKAEYRRLREKVLDVLVPIMADDEGAKEAYRAVSFLETGR